MKEDKYGYFKILPGNVLYCKWPDGRLELEEVKVIMEIIIEYMMAYGITKYVDDISACLVDWESADQWIVNDWYPRALAAGGLSNAIIAQPPAHYQVDDGNFQLRTFYTFQLAIEWINSRHG